MFFKKKIKHTEVKYTTKQLKQLKDLLDIYKDDELNLIKHASDILFGVGHNKNLEQSTAEILDFTNSFSEVHPLSQTFWINGLEFGFHPNLSNLTVGEFVDLSNYETDVYNNAEKILAILYRPITKRIGESYDIEPYMGSDKYSKIMLEVDYRIILGAYHFFVNLNLDLSSHLVTCFHKKTT